VSAGPRAGDSSAVAALDASEGHYAATTPTSITGLNIRSRTLHGKLSGKLAAAH
jgi:hypothetical protein